MWESDILIIESMRLINILDIASAINVQQKKLLNYLFYLLHVNLCT